MALPHIAVSFPGRRIGKVYIRYVEHRESCDQVRRSGYRLSQRLPVRIRRRVEDRSHTVHHRKRNIPDPGRYDQIP